MKIHIIPLVLGKKQKLVEKRKHQTFENFMREPIVSPSLCAIEFKRRFT